MSKPAKTSNEEEEVVEIGRVADMCEDIQFKNTIYEFGSRLEALGKIIKTCCGSGMYPKLSIEEKVKFDLFLSYSLTSMYWVYLRTQGENPVVQMKSELDRIKKYMDKSKQIHDRKSMPRLDQEAAKRFVRSGLWNPNRIDNAVSSRKRKHTTFEEEDNN